MSDIVPQAAIVCSACGGDPRTSLQCTVCGGAGVGVPSEQGFLVWLQPIDDFYIALRKIRRTVATVFHLALLVVVLASVVMFAWQVFLLEDPFEISTPAFWLVGHWYVAGLWLGAFVLCFLIYRMAVYGRDALPIPGWDAPVHHGAVASPPHTQQHQFDVSRHFSDAAMEVVENAYRVTKSLGCTEVQPAMLFAAAIVSSSGGSFMARLGLSFEKMKEPLARLMAATSHGNPPITFSRETKRTLALAYADAVAHHREYVGPMEIFAEAFQESPAVQDLVDQLGFPPTHVAHVAEWIRLQEQLRDDYRRFLSLAAFKPKNSMNRAMTARNTPLLDQFSQDLTLAARGGYLAAAIGRTKEIDSVLQAIESGNRSVALVGPTGVGKSAIVAEIARRMVEEDVPKELFDKRLVSVNVAQLVAGGDQSMAGDRLLAMLDEVALSGNIVLAFEGIEALVGSGAASMDLAQVLASEISKRYFIALATTTQKAWTESIEYHVLGTSLVKVNVAPLDTEETLAVLMAKSGSIEYQQQVFFSYAALEKATSLALRYLYDVASPENALGVIREAAVLARKTKGEQAMVTPDDIATVIHQKTDIPVEAVSQSETEKLLNLESHLHGRVIGQDDAVSAVSQAMRRARAELREGRRPIVNLLFMGPTGVGKTELAKALASEYFGNETSMIRVDMSEYQESSSVERMIGAPGDQRGGLLTEAVRHHPFAIVLLDEIEKAHADILNLFLQVMDDGRLTDGVGRTVDFTNTVVIMTSNAGTPFIQAEVSKGTPIDQIKTALMERELKGIFRPEFLNRFDGVIVFKPLTMDDVTQITWLLLHGIQKRLEEKGIGFRAEDPAVEALARAGYDPLFGARPLRRVIQERIETALADLILRKAVERKDIIVLAEDGTLKVEKRVAM